MMRNDLEPAPKCIWDDIIAKVCALSVPQQVHLHYSLDLQPFLKCEPAVQWVTYNKMET